MKSFSDIYIHVVIGLAVIFILEFLYISHIDYIRNKQLDYEENKGIFYKNIKETLDYIKEEENRKKISTISLAHSSISGFIRGSIIGAIINGVEGAITGGTIYAIINPIMNLTDHCITNIQT